jgi:Protein of unknown function (DUF4229)
MTPNGTTSGVRRNLGGVARSGSESGRTASQAVLIYNVCRLGLLGLCLGLGWLATLRGVLLIVVALAVSGAISWFALRPQRIAMGLAVERTVERSRVHSKLAERTAAEDAYVDSLSSPPPAGPGDDLPT